MEPTDPQSSQAMSLLREAALEARRLYRRIDVVFRFGNLSIQMHRYQQMRPYRRVAHISLPF
jgi:predicted NAD/FAD-binding protein